MPLQSPLRRVAQMRATSYLASPYPHNPRFDTRRPPGE